MNRALKDLLFLRRLTRQVPVPIQSGPNQGLRWSIATSGRFLKGTFESSRVNAITALMSPDDCFWDCGAHYGYVTLAAARRVRQVVAFEPFPPNQWYLRKHVEWNHLESVTVCPFAISGCDGESNFHPWGASRGHLSDGPENGHQTVSTRSIDSLVQEHPPPTYLKVDIEGAEADLLRGGEQTLGGASLLMVLATHSPELRKECTAILQDYGYRIVEPSFVNEPGARSVSVDPDLLAIGPGREVAEAAVEQFRSSR